MEDNKNNKQILRDPPGEKKKFFWVLLVFVLIIGIWIGVQGANQGVLTLATSAQGLTKQDGNIKVRIRAIDAANVKESLYTIDQTAVVKDGQLKLRWQIPGTAKKKAAYIEVCAMDKRAGPSASVKKSCIEQSGDVAYNKVSCPYYVPANSTGFSGQLNGWNKLDDSQKVGCAGTDSFGKVSSLQTIAAAQSPGIQVDGGGVLVAENGKIETKDVDQLVKDALSQTGNSVVQVTTNVPTPGPQGAAGANGKDGTNGADGAVGVATVSGGGLILSGQNLSLDDSCVGGQILQWNGSSWNCATVSGTDSQTLSLAANVLAISGGNSVNLSMYLDNTDSQALSWVSGTRTLSLTGGGSVVISDSDTTYSAGNGLSLSGTTFSINSPTCAGTTKLTWNGTAFSCAADVDTDTTNFNIAANGGAGQNIASGGTVNFTNGTGTTASRSGSDISFGLNNTAVSAGTYSASNNANGSLALPQFTVDAQGRLTAASTSNVTLTGIANSQLANSAITVNTAGPLAGGGSVSLGGSLNLSLDLSDAGDSATATTSSGSGLEISGNEVGLIRGCSSNQLLKWNSGSLRWECATDTDTDTNSGGTVTSITAGTGLTGGTITTSGTINIATTGVTAATYGSSTSIPVITVNAQGQITAASSTAIPNASTSTTGLLTSTDWNTFNGKENVLTFTGNGLFSRSGNTVTGLACSAGEIPKWTAGAFACGADNNSGTTYSAGNGLSLGGSTFSINSPTCAGTDKLTWSGTAFSCATDVDTDTDTTNFNVAAAGTGGSQNISSGGTVTFGNGTGTTATRSGSTVTYGLNNTAVSAGSYAPADNANGSLALPQFTVDAQGRLTAASTTNVTLTGIANSQLANSAITINTTGPITGGGSVSLGGSLTLNFDLSDAGDNNTATTSSGSGLEVSSGEIGLLRGCSTGELLKYNTTSKQWACASDTDTNSGGTVTSITAGTGLTGGTITTSGTINIATTGVTAATYGSSTSIPVITVNAQGQITAASSSAIPTADTSTNGLLTSTDWNTFNGKENVLTFNGNGLFSRSGNTITGLACSAGEIPKWSGSAFGCAADAGGASYTAGNGLSLTGASFSVNSPTCAGTDKLTWSGTAFSCAADVDTDTDTTNFNVAASGTGGSQNISSGGTVTFSSGTGTTATRSGSTVTYGLNNTAVSAGTYSPSDNANGSLALPQFTVDAQGRLTAASTTNVTLTGIANSQLTNSAITVNTTGPITGGGSVSLGGSLTLNFDLSDAGDANTATTSSGSGLEVSGGEIGLLRGCSTGELLKYNTTSKQWACAADTDTNSGGTVTSITAGTGLSGGTITTSGTIDIANTGVTAATYGSSTSIPVIAVNAQGQITSATSTAIPTANTSTTGLLTSTDWNTFNGKENVLTFTGNGLFSRSGNTITGLACTGSQIAKWSGSAFACGTDNDTTYSAGNGLSLSSTTFSINSPTCSGTDKLQWTGSVFVCSADVDTDTGVTSVGTIDSQTKSANGAVISGTSLVLQTADGSNPGLVSTTTQTFAGAKTFSGNVNANGDVTLGDAAADGITITGEIRGASPLAFEGLTNDGVYTTFAITDPTVARTITFPDRSGTVSLSGDTFTGDVTGTLSSTGATALTIAANSVALGTDTTGDYVAGNTAGNGISVSGSAGEGWSPTISINAPTCAGTDKLTWNGSAFSCASDVDTDTDTTNFNVAASGTVGSQNISSGGTVTFSAGTGTTATRSGSTVTYGLANTAVSAGTYAPSDNANGSLALPQFTVDAQGRLTAASTTNVTLTGIANSQLANSGITVNTSGGLSGGSSVSLGGTLNLSIDLSDAGDANSATTSSGSGLETVSGEIGLLRGCATNELLKYNSTTKLWACAADVDTNSGGTVTSITAGTGLSGGTITTSGTIDIANTGVTAATYGSSTSIPVIAVNAQGQITSATSTAIPTANTSTTGLLTSTDWNTFNGKENVLTFTGNGLFSRSGNTITGLACTGSQIVKWSGSAFACGTDVDTDTGVTSVGAFSGSSIANGASISGTVITFGPADGTNPGMVTTGTQTFAGAKTFSTSITTPTINSTAALGITAGSTLTLNSTTTSAVTIDSGTTGAINIGTNANAKTITIGNSTGATSLVLNSGTGAINVGTNAVAHTITLGNSTGATSVVLNAGTGPINIGTNAIAHTVTLGNVTGATSVVVDCGTGACSFGASATDHTTTIGSATGVSATNIQSGTGNINLQSAGSGTTGNIQVGAGGAGSTTPDLLVLDIKSSSGDPTGTTGAMYYNSNAAKFRCYQNGAWADCITTDTNTTYTAGNGLSLGGTTFSINSPTCSGTDKLTWSGTAFSCGSDVDTTNFNIAANGGTGQNIASGNTVNFVNGTGTTASRSGNDISFALNNTAVTAASYAPSDNANGSLALPQFTVDAQGRLTAASTTNVTLTGIANSQLTNSAITVNTSGGLSGGSSVSLGGTINLTLDLSDAGDTNTATTSSGSGLEVSSGEIGLLRGCATNELLKYNSTTKLWACAADVDTNSGGTVTSITAGTGLSGGTITTSGTIDIANTGVTAATYGSSTSIPVIAVNAQGQITSATSTAIPTANTSTTGLLTSTDWNTFNGKENVLTFTGNGLFSRSGNTITGLACSSGDIPKWSGSAFACGSDIDTGVTTIGTIDSVTKSANGAVISGTSLIMQTADATHPGLVSTGTQTIAGAKTFTGNLTVDNTGNLTVNGSTGGPIFQTDNSLDAIFGEVDYLGFSDSAGKNIFSSGIGSPSTITIGDNGYETYSLGKFVNSDSFGVPLFTSDPTSRSVIVGGTGADSDFMILDGSGNTRFHVSTAAGGISESVVDLYQLLSNTLGTTLISADGTTGRVGIGVDYGMAGYTLDVGGDTNISAGSKYRINGLDINTAGTLTNVAYLNQANTFTLNNNFSTSITTPQVLSTAGLSVTGGTTLSLRSTGSNAVSLDSTGTGAINIGNSGASAKTITIGNGNGATAVTLDTGTGIMNLGTNATQHNVAIGSTTGTSAVTINSGTGNSQFAANATDHTTTVGSVTGVSNTNIRSGTGGIALISAGSASGNVYIGNGSASATPDSLVLDVKNTSGDPTGTDGAMYYNSSTAKFRCYQNGAWADCITTDTGVTSIGTIDSLTKSADGAVISGTSLVMQTADATHPGLVSTGTQTFAGDKTFTGNLTGTGTVTFQNAVDSGNAFNISDSAGNALLTANTLAREINIGALGTDSSFTLTDTSGAADLIVTTSGGGYFASYADQFDIYDSTGTFRPLGVDSPNNRVGIGLGGSAPAYTLDVGGDVNIASGAVYRANGTAGLSSTTCSGGQFLQNQNIRAGLTTAGTCANGGVNTVGTFSGSSIANGASISGTTITFGPADASNPGMVTTGTQTFAGGKTFSGAMIVNNTEAVRTTSTNAFRVQTSGGAATVFLVDTSNQVVRIGAGVGTFAHFSASQTTDIYADGGFNLLTTAGSALTFDPNAFSVGEGSTSLVLDGVGGSFQVGDGVGQILLSGGKLGVGVSPSLIYTLNVDGDANLASGSVYRIGGTAGATTTCSGGQILLNPVLLGGLTTSGTCTSGAVTSIGTIDSQTKSANGAVISGNTLVLQTADATHPGLVSTGTQTFAGDKTFTGNLTATGTVLHQNSSDSTSAFKVNKANGENLIKFDTATTNNLFSNGNFESNTTGWAAKGSATLSQNTSQYYLGSGSMQIATTAAANDGAKYNYSLAAQTAYTMTFYVKSSSLTTAVSTISVGYSADGSTDTDCATSQTSNGAGFTKITCTFTTAAVSGTTYVYIKQSDATARNFYVDAAELQTTGSNLVLNPDLEVDASNWGSYGGATIAQTTSQSYTGSGSLQVDTSGSGVTEGATFAPTVAPSTTYTISLWAKTDAATSGSKTGTLLKRLDTVDSGSGSTCTTKAFTPGTWTNITCTFTTATTTGTSPFVSLNFTDDGVTPITYYIDTANMTLTKWNSNDIGRISLNGSIDSPLVVRGQNSTGAVQVQQMDGTSTFTVDTLNGRVGIGTEAPAKTLEVDGKTLIRATNTDTDTFQVVSSATIGAANSVAFNVAASSRSVSVGLSSNTANASLNVFGTQLINTKVNNASAFRISNSSSVGVFTFSTTTGNNRLTIGNTGTSTDGKLSIVNSSGSTVMEVDSSGTGYAQISSDYFEVIGQTSGISTIYSDGVNGFVGIGGNITPSYALDVIGDINSSTGYRIAGTAGASTTCSGGQFLQNQVVVGGLTTGGTCAAASGSGVTTVGAFSGSSIANGASISGSTITFGPADVTNPGMVTTGTQTFAGAKTFNGATTLAGTPTITNGLVSSGVADGASAVGFNFNTPSYTTAGANLLVVANNGVGKFSIDKDGNALIASGAAYKAGIYTGITGGCTSGQFVSDITAVGGLFISGNCANAVSSIGTFSGASIANGGSMSGNVLTFGAADGTNPGMVTTGTQTIAGAKTLTSALTINTSAVDTGLTMTGNINSFYQMNIQNTNSGSSASSDFVATANNGTSTTNYVDFGINGSAGGAAPFTGANDAYLYASDSNNLHIGALGSSGAVKFYTTGGTSSPSLKLTLDSLGALTQAASSSTTTAFTLTANSLTSGNGLAIASTNTGTTGNLLSVTSASTSAFTNGGIRWNFTGAHTGNALQLDDATATGNVYQITANSLTSGNGLVISSTGTGLTGNALSVTSGSTSALTNGIVRYNFTGAHTGNGFQIDDATTTGTAMQINASALTTGLAFQITGPSGANLVRVKNDSTQNFNKAQLIIGAGDANNPDALARDQLYVFGRINSSWNQLWADCLTNEGTKTAATTPTGAYGAAWSGGTTTPRLSQANTTGQSGTCRIAFATPAANATGYFGTGGLVTQRSLNPVFESAVLATSDTDTVALLGFSSLASTANITTSTNQATEEVFFRKQASNTQWEAVTRSTANSTENITTNVGSNNATHRFRIELDDTAAAARFYVDGTLVATHSTNAVPATSARLSAGATYMVTSTTSRNLDIDYMRVWSDDPPASVAPGTITQNDGIDTSNQTATSDSGSSPPEDNSNDALLARIKNLETDVDDLKQYKDVLTTEMLGDASSKKAVFIADTEFRKQVEFSADALFKANVNVDGTLNANGRVVVSNNTGTVTAQPGQTEVQVLFAKPLGGKPNVFLSTEDPDVKVVARERTKDGFIIKLSQPITDPLDIQWFAVEKE